MSTPCGFVRLCNLLVASCVVVCLFVAPCTTSYLCLSRNPSTSPAPSHRATPQCRRLAASPEPIPGWTPPRLKGGGWGARFQGDTRICPTDLAGLTIAVETCSGDSWNATVTEVLERSADLALVHAQRLYQ